MKVLGGLLGRLTQLFAVAGALGVIGLICVTGVAVFWRYFLNDPIFGSEDISVLLLIFVAAGAVCYGAQSGAHVSVNVITYFFGRTVTRWTDALMRALAFGICALAAYGLVTRACGIEKACVTGNLSIEHTVFYYVLSAAMGLMALHYLVQFCVGLAHWNGTDPNELRD